MEGETRRIKTKTMDGKIEEYKISPDMPIPEFKRIVAERSGVPLDRLRLIYRARVLEEDKKISDYITEDDHIVHLMAKTLRTGSA